MTLTDEEREMIESASRRLAAQDNRTTVKSVHQLETEWPPTSRELAAWLDDHSRTYVDELVWALFDKACEANDPKYQRPDRYR